MDPVLGPGTLLAVLGDPLLYTCSPTLHEAGLRALGLEGVSVAVRTPLADLGTTLARLRDHSVRGVNLTHPLKEAALAHVTRASQAASASRSVNTVGFEPHGTWGDTTDGEGFVDLVRSLGRDPARERLVLLGAGGAARSIALAMRAAGGTACAWARTPETARDAWSAIGGAAPAQWGGPEARAWLADATLVVNATPRSAPDLPLPAPDLPRRALVIDLTYGAALTPWVTASRAAGRDALDGLGLLVFQARRSLMLWFGADVPIEPLARAVGWPR